LPEVLQLTSRNGGESSSLIGIQRCDWFMSFDRVLRVERENCFCPLLFGTLCCFLNNCHFIVIFC
jgi:hypothetical protein